MSSSEPRAPVYEVDFGAILAPALAHWLRILLVTVAAVAVAYALLLFVPRTYEATASLVVDPQADAVAGGQPVQADTDLLMSSQLGLIRSDDVLNAVVTSQNLREVPEFSDGSASPLAMLLNAIGIRQQPTTLDQSVLASLRDRLDVSASRTSGEITITVRSADPGRAAALANAIAAESVKRRAAEAQSDSKAAVSWLEQEIGRLRQKVTDAENAVAAYRADNGLFDGAGATPVTAQDLTTISTQIAEAQQRQNDAEARADLIRGLIKSGQPLDGVSDVQKSVVIQGLLSTLASLRADLAQKSTTLLANHPVIKALKAQIGEIQGQVDAEARRVADALDAEAKVETDLREKLRDDLARAKQAASTAAKGSVTLDDLERDLKVQRDLLASDLAKYAAATSTNGVSQDVRLLRDAAVPGEPSSPKVLLILTIVALVVLAGQIVAALLSDQGRTRRLRQDEMAYGPMWATEVDDRADASNEAGPDGFGEELGDAEQDATVLADPLDELEESPEEESWVVDFTETAAPEVDADPWLSDSDLVLADALAAAEQLAAADDGGLEEAAEAGGLEKPVLDLEQLSIMIGRDRPAVVLLACVADFADGAIVAGHLAAEAQERGDGVAEVDAGSAAVSLDEGLTDLCAGRADFGDVVDQSDDLHAVVPWGRLATLDRRSPRAATLLGALAGLYPLTLVNTGKIGLGSSLPLFVGTDATLVLVTDTIAGRETNARAIRDVEALGFVVRHVASVPNFRYRVA